MANYIVICLVVNRKNYKLYPFRYIFRFIFTVFFKKLFLSYRKFGYIASINGILNFATDVS